MFNTTHDIYQHIATHIVQCIQEPNWKTGWLIVSSNRGSETINIKTGYQSNGATKTFNPFYSAEHNLGKATSSLFNLLKNKTNDNPFNKYKFTLNNDGTFDIEFKYDEDFAYMKSLDADSDEFDELLELDVTDQIESWEGLPEDHPRPWVTNTHL